MEYPESHPSMTEDTDFLIDGYLAITRGKLQLINALYKEGKLLEGEFSFLHMSLYEHTLLLIGRRSLVDCYQTVGFLIAEHGSRCDFYNIFLDSALGQKKYGRYYSS
jgi:hypothetical protein